MAVQLTPQRRVLAVAASQVGYNRWSDPKQGTKYARETQPVFWPRDTWLLANGINYCDIFVTWVFWKALGEDFVKEGHLPAGASYNTDYRASKGGRVSKSEAAPGDILVFDWNFRTASTNHVGILEKRLSGDRFQTIEGNTSLSNVGSQDSGGRVARRVRRHDQVRYVIRPNWSKAGGASSTPASKPSSNVWDTSPRIKGMSKAEVVEIQNLLVGAGYSVGSYGADGSYKGDTVNAVKAAQKALGLSVDGVAGPATVEALRKAQKGTSKPTAPVKPVKTSKPMLKVDGVLGDDTAKRIQAGLKVKQDGVIGPDSIKAWQKMHGTPVDGKITGQGSPARSSCPAIRKDCLVLGSGGSKLVRSIQTAIGMKGKAVDGKLGPTTVKNLQAYYNRLG